MNIKAMKILAVITTTILFAGCLGQNNPPTTEEKTVKEGDKIKVDYIGYIGIWNNTTETYEKGGIFDTSIYNIANDTNYTKSEEFEKRDKSSYTSLEFIVGSGEMIKGFDDGVIGMRVNENRTVIVQPKDGYGEFNLSNIDNTTKLYLEVNITETINKAEFERLTNETAKEGIKFIHPVYQWNSTVYEVEGDIVIIKNLPYEDDWNYFINRTIQIRDYAWNSTIVSINESIIKLKHAPEKGKKVNFNGKQGRIYSIDETNETILIDLNHKLAGKVLIFEITLLAILPPKKSPF